ncbi:uncharacterized protein LOC141706442 [Apium graveolens]|uniref:uncharacterized protein LOC141706442 n=1 Tax=Apium graveolens TaxID=4045 RepID=UPI003D7ACF59
MARECKSPGPIRSMMSVSMTSSTVPAEVLTLPPPSEPVPQASSRNFNLKMKDVVHNSEVIVGKLSVNNVEAKVLIDLGATRSFISENFAGRLNCDKKNMSEIMNILGEFDIILGMDWLRKNNAQIDSSKRVYSRTRNRNKVMFKGQKQGQMFLSADQQNKLLGKGYEAFLAYVVNTKKEVPRKEKNMLVKELPNVFPEELPGVPLDRQIEFEINLALGAEPVLKAPYKMEPTEMKELASELQ